MKISAPNAAIFDRLCVAHGLPVPKHEYKFYPTRRWKFDWAWVEYKVALEMEGGAFHGPGHRSVGVFLKNMEKYNEAAISGWALLRCTTKDLESGAAFELVARAIASLS